MEDIPQQIQEKLEEVFLGAKDDILKFVLAGWDRKTPLHFSQIEARCHWVATLWSRALQEWAARELTAEHPDSAACQTCGEMCVLELAARTILSTDGPVPILEWKGTCTRCRRDFFPDAGSDGAGQPGVDAGDDATHCSRRRRDAIQPTRMNEIEDRRVMGEVLAPHGPIGVLTVGDKRLARRGGEAALPSRRRQRPIGLRSVSATNGQTHRWRGY
jgi:hypothetical protein